MMFDVREHIGLRGLNDIEIGWASRFVPDSINPAVLEGLSCIEVRVDDLNDDDGLAAEALRRLDDLLWGLLKSELGKGYLIRTNGDVTPKGQLKSYRGLFPREWKASGVAVEQEIVRGNGSFFLGVAQLNDGNRVECFTTARDIFRACLLIAEEDNAKAVWAEAGEAVSQSLRIMDSVVIDYCTLIPRIASAGRTIVTFGIDTRGDFVNASLFLDDSLRSTYVSALRVLRRTMRS